MKIGNTGVWENVTWEGHEHDEGLAQALASFFALQFSSSIIDLGCGTGYYADFINSRGIKCDGVDGNPYTESMTNGRYRVADLSGPQNFGEYDWVLSLEVGEHIPKQFENAYIDNLHRHNRCGIVLSWAIPGQGGDGHVNCKTNETVIQKLFEIDYRYDSIDTNKLRAACSQYPTPCYWFRDTLMVFRNGALSSKLR